MFFHDQNYGFHIPHLWSPYWLHLSNSVICKKKYLNLHFFQWPFFFTHLWLPYWLHLPNSVICKKKTCFCRTIWLPRYTSVVATLVAFAQQCNLLKKHVFAEQFGFHVTHLWLPHWLHLPNSVSCKKKKYKKMGGGGGGGGGGSSDDQLASTNTEHTGEKHAHSYQFTFRTEINSKNTFPSGGGGGGRDCLLSISVTVLQIEKKPKPKKSTSLICQSGVKLKEWPLQLFLTWSNN